MMFRKASGQFTIVGDMVGNNLTQVPSQIILFKQFKAFYPDGNVLSKEYLILRKDGLYQNSKHDSELISLTDVERDHIRKVLEKTDWNKTEAARILGIAKSTLYQKIEEYKLSNS